jgi:hypothetical protein
MLLLRKAHKDADGANITGKRRTGAANRAVL